jgi:hypothetical protein
MHPTALAGFTRMLRPMDSVNVHHVVDIGGADVNGTIYGALSSACPGIASLTTVDIADGQGVALVADATDLTTYDRLLRLTPIGYDMVISTETFEHVRPHGWVRIIDGVHSILRPGGIFIGTCASLGRRPHGARGERDVPDGEWYENVDPTSLIATLSKTFTGALTVEYSKDPAFPTTHDLYWRAVK